VPTATTDLIRKIDFFEPLDDKIINKIAQVCIPREYSKGDYIVKEGESGLGLFFITAGKVQVEIERNGTKSVLAQLKDEDFLGELSIIDNKPRSANVVCLEDTSCLLLTRDSFSKLMNKYPEIAVQMAKALAGRIRATNEKMSQTGATPAPPPVSAAPQDRGEASPASSGTPAAVAAASNGSSSPTKDKVRDFLIDTFDFLYTMKALTRFSVAVVGCPVSVSTVGNEIASADIQGVKVVVFPADRDEQLCIRAHASGPYSATVLRPGGRGRFNAWGAVRHGTQLFLRVPANGKVSIE
jgi:CRP/FNR family transcriptional regulator, cyclic AMP receptor protein